MMGWYRWLDDIVTPLFEALRFVAPIAWVPFAALWFGTGIGGPVLIIFSGAFPPCLINAYRGARFVETRYIEAAQTLGARQLARHLRSAAAGVRAVDRRGAAHQRGPRLAIADRRRADRRVERHRLPDGQGPEQHQHVDRDGGHDRASASSASAVDVLLRRVEAEINRRRGFVRERACKFWGHLPLQRSNAAMQPEHPPLRTSAHTFYPAVAEIVVIPCS